jgi:hypothetical protein
MTERPTEQTSPRMPGLDVNGDASPTSQTASTAAPSRSARLQQRFASATGVQHQATTRPAEQTSVRPAAPAQTGPILPPPAPDMAPPQPAVQKTQNVQQAPTRPARASKAVRPPRRARLRLTRIDPWSVMKTSFLLSIALGVVTIVSVLMVWSVLGAAGVWDSINTTVRDIVGDQANNPFTIQDYLGTDRVIGFTMLVAVIDVVLITAIATLSAFLYNMAAALLGGIDITLVEDEH